MQYETDRPLAAIGGGRRALVGTNDASQCVLGRNPGRQMHAYSVIKTRARGRTQSLRIKHNIRRLAHLARLESSEYSI